jgi:hypothetical protein
MDLSVSFLFSFPLRACLLCVVCHIFRILPGVSRSIRSVLLIFVGVRIGCDVYSVDGFPLGKFLFLWE